MLFDYLRAILLVMLAVCGNFVAQTLGCGTQKLLSRNMAFKQLVIVFMIFFSLGFAERNMEPTKSLIFASVIYIFYIMFSKMELTETIMSVGLLALTYVLRTYISYYGSKGINLDKAEIVTKILVVVIAMVIFSGFTRYFVRQRREHIHEWSTKTFLFGLDECDHFSG